MYMVKNVLDPMISSPKYMKTIIISVSIMILDYLLQEQFTMALKVSRI